MARCSCDRCARVRWDVDGALGVDDVEAAAASRFFSSPPDSDSDPEADDDEESSEVEAEPWDSARWRPLELFGCRRRVPRSRLSLDGPRTAASMRFHTPDPVGGRDGDVDDDRGGGGGDA